MGTASRAWRKRPTRVLAAACLIAVPGLVSGCSSGRVAESLPASLGGLPQDMPERPAVQPEYPAVHDMPPPRTDSTLSEDEKKRLKDELIASRERAALRAGAKPGGVTQKAAATTKAGTTKKPDSAATGGTQPAGVARDP